MKVACNIPLRLENSVTHQEKQDLKTKTSSKSSEIKGDFEGLFVLGASILVLRHAKLRDQAMSLLNK